MLSDFALFGSWTIPIKIQSEANLSCHWTKKRGRKKYLQFFIKSAMEQDITKNKATHGRPVPIPCRVVLTRIGRSCDPDNLISLFKNVKDEVASIIFPEKIHLYLKKGKVIENKGHCDSDPRVSWEYKQEPKGKRPDSFRIEIYQTKQDEQCKQI